jgi:hypothetical protein
MVVVMVVVVLLLPMILITLLHAWPLVGLVAGVLLAGWLVVEGIRLVGHVVRTAFPAQAADRRDQDDDGDNEWED